MYRLPLVWADGDVQRLQDQDILSPSSVFQYTRYYIATKNWEIKHGYGRKITTMPYWCFGDDGPFYAGVSEEDCDLNYMRLDIAEPTSGILLYLNLAL